MSYFSEVAALVEHTTSDIMEALGQHDISDPVETREFRDAVEDKLTNMILAAGALAGRHKW